MHHAMQKLSRTWSVKTILTRNLNGLLDNLSKYPNISIAAINSSTQILISGYEEFLDQGLGSSSPSSGILKVMKMNMAGAPFHSPLLDGALEQFERHLRFTISNHSQKSSFINNVISNVTAKPFPSNNDNDNNSIIQLLRDQIIKTVQWKDGMEYLVHQCGINLFLFTGPGRVLHDIHKREYSQFHLDSILLE